jgi:hypothetical protein
MVFIKHFIKIYYTKLQRTEKLKTELFKKAVFKFWFVINYCFKILRDTTIKIPFHPK